MSVLLIVVGIIETLAGVAVALQAKSAIHEILATAGFGFGVLTIGIAVIIRRMEEMIRATASAHMSRADPYSDGDGNFESTDRRRRR